MTTIRYDFYRLAVIPTGLSLYRLFTNVTAGDERDAVNQTFFGMSC